MSHYAKGRRSEYKTQAVLEAAGYDTTRSASSKGKWDVAAVGPGGDVRFISVKCGTARPTAVEREALRALAQKAHGRYTVEVWRWVDRARDALIEVFE